MINIISIRAVLNIPEKHFNIKRESKIGPLSLYTNVQNPYTAQIKIPGEFKIPLF
jgi:hypothetical protein